MSTTLNNTLFKDKKNLIKLLYDANSEYNDHHDILAEDRREIVKMSDPKNFNKLNEEFRDLLSDYNRLSNEGITGVMIDVIEIAVEKRLGVIMSMLKNKDNYENNPIYANNIKQKDELIYRYHLNYNLIRCLECNQSVSSISSLLYDFTHYKTGYITEEHLQALGFNKVRSSYIDFGLSYVYTHEKFKFLKVKCSYKAINGDINLKIERISNFGIEVADIEE